MRTIASQLEHSHSTSPYSSGLTYAHMAHSQPNFLRDQLAMYQERKLNPRWPDTPFRGSLVLPDRP